MSPLKRASSHCSPRSVSILPLPHVAGGGKRVAPEEEVTTGEETGETYAAVPNPTPIVQLDVHVGSRVGSHCSACPLPLSVSIIPSPQNVFLQETSHDPFAAFRMPLSQVSPAAGFVFPSPQAESVQSLLQVMVEPDPLGSHCSV